MIHISNLRKESSEGWTKLIVDITHGGGGSAKCLPEPVMWMAVQDEYAYMLSDDVYDAFMLVPLYLGMYYKEDIHIHGCVSKKLYKNVMNYLQRILCDFSDDLSRINITVDGFKVADGEPDIIGAGLSCGVDSLSTVYDRYVKENDPDYRINGLFFFNTGWYGEPDNPDTEKLYLEHYAMAKSAADDMNLPIYFVNTNFHAFMYSIYRYRVGRMGYFANYSCIFGMSRAIRKYYTSSAFSYAQILDFGHKYRDDDFSEFSESYSVPLIQTDRLELILDGCQYERSQKTENIADWDIAHKYVNPCNGKSYTTNSASNCSSCEKCMLTMITLDAIGKLEKFADIFDLNKYRKHLFSYKVRAVYNHFRHNMQGNEPDIYVFLTKNGMKLPSYSVAWIYTFTGRAFGFMKKVCRKIMGDSAYEALKRTLKR